MAWGWSCGNAAEHGLRECVFFSGEDWGMDDGGECGEDYNHTTLFGNEEQRKTSVIGWAECALALCSFTLKTGE